MFILYQFILLKYWIHTIWRTIQLTDQIRHQTPRPEKKTEKVLIGVVLTNILFFYLQFLTCPVWSSSCPGWKPDIFPCMHCTTDNTGCPIRIHLQTSRPRKPRCCGNHGDQRFDRSPGDAASCGCWTEGWECCTVHTPPSHELLDVPLVPEGKNNAWKRFTTIIIRFLQSISMYLHHPKRVPLRGDELGCE